MILNYQVVIERNAPDAISRIVIPDLALEFHGNQLSFNHDSLKAIEVFCHNEITKKIEDQISKKHRINEACTRQEISEKFPQLGSGPDDSWLNIKIAVDYKFAIGFAEKYLPYYGVSASMADHALDAINDGVLLSLSSTKIEAIVAIVFGFFAKAIFFVFFPQAEYLNRTGKLIDDTFTKSKNAISRGLRKLSSLVWSPPPALEEPLVENLAEGNNFHDSTIDTRTSTKRILAKLAVTGVLGYAFYAGTIGKYNQFGATDAEIAADFGQALMSAELYFYFSRANFISGLTSDPFEFLSAIIFIYEKIDSMIKAKQTNTVSVASEDDLHIDIPDTYDIRLSSSLEDSMRAFATNQLSPLRRF